jgi:electron transfer flavoprotein-quinone oxidoreductase
MGASADVIIVGAGLSGGAAALAAAGAGRHPLLVDPKDGSAGDVAGAGILGPRDLPEGIPGGFPIERTLGDRHLAFLGASSCVSIDYQEPGLPGAGPPISYIRSRTDAWLATQAVAAGAERRSGRIEALLTEGGRVAGIVLDGAPVRASLTVLADGPRASELTDGLSASVPAGKRTTIDTERLMLPSGRIEERFSLSPGNGCSIHAILGNLPAAQVASGFLVTHESSITVGIRASGELGPDATAVLRSTFRDHSAIAPYLQGASPIAGSARRATLPERRHRWEGPGWRLAGASAGLPDFPGAVLRGRNDAFRSGWLAGQLPAGAGYSRRLRSEGMGRNDPRAQDPLIGDPRIHGSYPELVAFAFHRLMTDEGRPKESVTTALRATRRGARRGWSTMARDAAGAVRRL